MTDELTLLPNIGEALAAKLRAVGVTNYDDLANIGSIEAVLRMGPPDKTAVYNMLYALEGAIQGIRWHAIPKEERDRLKAEFDLICGF